MNANGEVAMGAPNAPSAPSAPNAGAGGRPKRPAAQLAAARLAGNLPPLSKNSGYLAAVASNASAKTEREARAAQLAGIITAIVNSASRNDLEEAYMDAKDATGYESPELKELYKELAKLRSRGDTYIRRRADPTVSAVNKERNLKAYQPVANKLAENDRKHLEAYRNYFINNKQLFKFLKARLDSQVAMGIPSAAAGISVDEIDELAGLMGGMGMGGGYRKRRRSARRSAHRKSRKAHRRSARRKSHH